MEAFKETQSLQVGEGRKATVVDGVNYNAIGLESTAELRHVAKAWQDQCTPFTDLYAEVMGDVANKRDEPVLESSVIVTPDLNLTNGYKLTDSGLSSLRMFTDVPSKMVDYLIDNGHSADVARYLNEALDNRRTEWDASHDEPRKFLLRLREDGNGNTFTRAICSDRYGVIDNADVLDMISKALPGGYSDVLASHMFNNGDNISGNLLLPDYIKQNPDSDYGVGIAFRNSEVRQSTFSISAFLFRAICFNGNIWSRKDSTIKVNQKHLGAIDMGDLLEQVKQAIMVGLTEGECLLTQLGYTQQVPVSDPLRLIASLSRDNGLSIEQGQAWHKGYQDSCAEAFGHLQDSTAFGIVNGLTQAAQRFDSDTKYDMESLSGTLITPSLDADLNAIIKRWDKYENRAELLDDKLVRKYHLVTA